MLSLFLGALLDQDSARQATAALSAGEYEFNASNVGRCWNVGEELLENIAIGTSDGDGQTGDLLGLIVCQRNGEEVWSGANETQGYATHVVAREPDKRLVRAQRDNEEIVVGIDATLLGREVWGGLRWWPLGERRERHRAQRQQRMRKSTVLQWILPRQFTVVVLLACVLSDGHRGCVLLVHAQGQDRAKMQKVGDFHMSVKQRKWCASVPLFPESRQQAVSRRRLID